MCKLGCPNGFEKNEHGCEICKCKKCKEQKMCYLICIVNDLQKMKDNILDSSQAPTNICYNELHLFEVIQFELQLMSIHYESRNDI